MGYWKKRIFACFLSSCLLMTTLPTAALAVDETAPERGTLNYTQAIAPQYEDAGIFSEGLAPVKKDGKWGYINENNEVVIPFQYDVAGIFSEGHAVVGSIVETLPQTEYDPATDQSHETGEYFYTVTLGCIDTNGSYRAFPDPYSSEGEAMMGQFTDDLLPHDMVFYNGYITLDRLDAPDGHLYDTNGSLVELTFDEYNSRYSFGWQVTENTVIIGEGAAAGGLQAYYNLDTHKVLEFPESVDGDYVYHELRPFNQGLAPVGRYSESTDTMKWGFIDGTGKFVIQPQYAGFTVSNLYGAYEAFGVTGVAMTMNMNGKYGGINKSGATVIPFEYDSLYNYSFGLALFEKNGKWGYLDENGKVAIAAQYAQATSFSSDGFAVAYDGSKAYLIDSTGKSIEGSENLNTDTYFTTSETDGSPILLTPDEYVVTNENGKYGYGKISYLPALPEASDMSDWAYEEVTAAIEENLVPTYLQNLYLNNITRDEFCDLTVQAVSETLGQEVENIVQQKTGKDLLSYTQQYPFYDTTNSNVIAAYALGIVNGRGAGKFDPYASITREEAAAFLMRSAKVLGMDTTQIEDAQFADVAAIDEVFRDAVNYVYQISVMNGTGGGKFTPEDNYTREQSFVTIYRLFQAALAK